ncbi:uncharacterized protein C2orf66 homolog [Latimeria chalumnae]|uniref:uncharacterized protein C2orf66 homolog n=1 Tax=Latimeria chalumnae TaxID=7897 RepID=UPI0003C1243A|nr:PREDICTED: uncharacterized protein C2orf66 homolog [Latimeria chalumnae]|eukprot:XP_005989583.1 PREDICTED: uncharacterized protein C2orf66 homolog [Latimeria chalumnae]
MLKVQILVLCITASLVVLVHASPLGREEKWKSLDNPRNRDLFFRTLQAYFSGRGLDVGRFSKSFPLDNERPELPALYTDPIASAFADYEGQKNSFATFLKG